MVAFVECVVCLGLCIKVPPPKSLRGGRHMVEGFPVRNLVGLSGNVVLSRPKSRFKLICKVTHCFSTNELFKISWTRNGRCGYNLELNCCYFRVSSTISVFGEVASEIIKPFIWTILFFQNTTWTFYG